MKRDTKSNVILLKNDTTIIANIFFQLLCAATPNIAKITPTAMPIVQ